MEVVPYCGVSTINERLWLSNLWGFYLPCWAASIIPTRHILGAVPCKIPVQGCTVYIDYKSVCTRELSMGTKTYLWSHSVKQIEHGFPHNNKGKQKNSWRVERLSKICRELLLCNTTDCVKQVSLLMRLPKNTCWIKVRPIKSNLLIPLQAKGNAEWKFNLHKKWSSIKKKKNHIAMWEPPFKNYLFLECTCIHYCSTKY